MKYLSLLAIVSVVIAFWFRDQLPEYAANAISFLAIFYVALAVVMVPLVMYLFWWVITSQRSLDKYVQLKQMFKKDALSRWSERICYLSYIVTFVLHGSWWWLCAAILLATWPLLTVGQVLTRAAIKDELAEMKLEFDPACRNN